MWILETELRFCGRAASVLNCCLPSTNKFFFFFFKKSIYLVLLLVGERCIYAMAVEIREDNSMELVLSFNLSVGVPGSELKSSASGEVPLLTEASHEPSSKFLLQTLLMGEDGTL